MALIILLLILLTALGAWESWRHARHRRRIPIRVHVNGSRGKSSVSRLIAAGLRGGGLRVVAKTTGSAACVSHVDGSETPVRRRGGPNIREQLGIFRGAVRERCDALVIECMAVRPDLQHTCEHVIVKATHGVITNARPDHLEVMGPTLEDVAANLGNTIPRRGHLFTSEAAFGEYYRQRAARLGSQFTLADPAAVSDEEMGRFEYVEFADNVALALATCMAAGVDRAAALRGMYKVVPDVGALTQWRLQESGKELTFINAFAANDPVSYIHIWNRLGLAARAGEVILLMNNRDDRMRRAKDLAPLFGRELVAGRYVLIGTGTAMLADMLRRQGLPMDRVEDLSGRPADELWRMLVDFAPPQALVVGIGNIADIGNDLLAHLRGRLPQEVV